MRTLIILPVSRFDHLVKIFNRLELLQCDRQNTDILVSVHGEKDLLAYTSGLVESSNFANKQVIHYKKKPVKRNGSPVARRQDIANIHNLIRTHIPKGQYTYIFGLEDDTLIADNTLRKLTVLASGKPNAGIISGVEVGRWGVPYIGAWKADNVYETTTLNTVLPFQQSGIEEVDATGLFCFIVKAEYYLAHEFKSYIDVLGADVDFGLALRQQGLQNYIDWSIQCGHINKGGEILYPDKLVKAVKYTKGKKTWHYTSYS